MESVCLCQIENSKIWTNLVAVPVVFGAGDAVVAVVAVLVAVVADQY